MFRLSNLRGDAHWLGGSFVILASLFVLYLAEPGGQESRRNVPVELVLIDADGDGLRLCPVESPARLGFGSRHIVVHSWTCAGDDDGWLLLANEGRPPSIADLLGLKVGPESGFDHLVLNGGGDPKTQVDSSASWFKYLLLWQDADTDRAIRDTELSGLHYLGFDRLILTSSRTDNTRLADGVIVTRRGAAIRSGTSHELVSLRFEAR